MRSGGIHTTGRSIRGPWRGPRGGMKYREPLCPLYRTYVAQGELPSLRGAERLRVLPQDLRRDARLRQPIEVVCDEHTAETIREFIPEVMTIGDLYDLTEFDSRVLCQIPGITHSTAGEMWSKAVEMEVVLSGLAKIRQDILDQRRWRKRT